MFRFAFPLWLVACTSSSVGPQSSGRPISEDPNVPNGDVDIDGDGVPASQDCNDMDPEVGAPEPERCNGLDDDCDGTIDEEAVDAVEWFADVDQDGFGDVETVTIACDAPEGFVASGTDCDDANAQTNPEANERCDGLDNDCNGEPDDGPNLLFVPTMFGSINEAIESAPQGAEICLLPRTYAGTITIGANDVVLAGVGAQDEIVFDRSQAASAMIPLGPGTGALTLRNLTFRGYNNSSNNGAFEGIFIDKTTTDDLVLDNVAIRDLQISVPDDESIDGAVIRATRGDLTLRNVQVEDVEVELVGSVFDDGHRVDGGLLHTNLGVVTIDGLDVTDMRITTASNSGDCDVRGGILNSVNAKAVHIRDFNVREVSLDLVCEDADVQGAITRIIDTSLDAANLRFEAIEVQAEGNQDASIDGLFYTSQVSGAVDAMVVQGNDIDAIGTRFVRGQGLLTLDSSNGLSVTHLTVWSNGFNADETGIDTSRIDGVAVVAEGEVSLQWVDIRGNRADAANLFGGSILLDADGKGRTSLTNAVIAGNSSGNPFSALVLGGGILARGNDIEIANVDLVGNQSFGLAVQGGGIAVEGILNLLMINHTQIINTYVETPFAFGAAFNPGFSMYDWRYNNVFGSVGGPDFVDGVQPDNTNLAVDPEYTFLDDDAVDWDLTLQPTSPAIDAGDPARIEPDGTPSDLGAYGGPDASGW
ncbi:MAG: MopE-related protein [Myxococcota bacterium]